MDTERNLLFGGLALQADLIDAAQFAEACTAWSRRKDLPLAELLIQRGWLTKADKPHVEYLLERKLNKHHGDVRASLASMSDEVRYSLAMVDDSVLQQSLAKWSAPPPDVDPWKTRPGLIVPEPPSGSPASLATSPNGAESPGRYSLLQVHAAGGMGQIWLSRDRDLGRTVALKELRPTAAQNPKLQARHALSPGPHPDRGGESPPSEASRG
jgi:hypothetical protein